VTLTTTSRHTGRLRALTALAAITLVVAACERPAPAARADAVATAQGAGDGAASTTQDEAGASAPAKPEKKKTKEEVWLESVGDSCLGDRYCPGYLRCVAESCQIPAAMTGERDERTPFVTFTDGSGEPLKFWIELAATPDQRERGLMFRREMLPDWGMLFVYPADRPLSFWMKNTYIPLDMVFIDSRGTVVGILENVPPLTLDSRSVGKPGRYVLELAAGRASAVGLEVGMKMSLERSPQPGWLPRP
jgi:hypothetical protein